MSGEQHNNLLERRVCLPKPDVNNITVLTQSLPNEPILPWHHYDSPWLEKADQEEGDPTTDDTAAMEEPTAVTGEAEDAAGVEQLSLLSLPVVGDLPVGEPSVFEASDRGEILESDERA